MYTLVRILRLMARSYPVVRSPLEVGMRGSTIATICPILSKTAVKILLFRVVAKNSDFFLETGFNDSSTGKSNTGTTLPLIFNGGDIAYNKFTCIVYSNNCCKVYTVIGLYSIAFLFRNFDLIETAMKLTVFKFISMNVCNHNIKRDWIS